MATINEDYVSYEVAKILKEKGFEGDINAYYHIWDYGNKVCSVQEFSHSEAPHLYVPAPTHQMAMKWLREKGLHLNAMISYDTSTDADGNEVDRWSFWFFEIYSSFGGELIYTEENDEYDSYEEAVEAAIKYCLEYLILN